jgi:SAM-dependent methyltransferase
LIPPNSHMSIRARAREIPRVASFYRSARSWYRAAFRFFPLSWLIYLRLGRIEPISRDFGLGRGQTIDRHYIEGFIERHRQDIRGRVLEIRDDNYTRRFGTAVELSDVLDLSPTNRIATIIGDLVDPATLAPDTYDCMIVTQTLQLIYEVKAAVENLHRALKPGGVLLVTLPGISQLATPSAVEGASLYRDYWRFTRYSASNIFGEFFAPEDLAVDSFGNVLAAVGFLHGVSAEEIGSRRLTVRDGGYDLLIAVRAVKS